MVEGLVFVAGLAAFELAAVHFGKSTRDGRDWSANSGPDWKVNE